MVHYKGKTNNHFECGVNIDKGGSLTTQLAYVTCVDCLVAIIRNNVAEHHVKDTRPHCDDCIHLNLTEDDQNIYFHEHNVKPPHTCQKLHVQVFHFSPDDPELHRNTDCVQRNLYRSPVEETSGYESLRQDMRRLKASLKKADALLESYRVERLDLLHEIKTLT